MIAIVPATLCIFKKNQAFALKETVHSVQLSKCLQNTLKQTSI